MKVYFEWIKEMFGKIRKRIKSFKNAFIECYITTVLNWPLIVFCTYFLLTGIASFHSIYFHFSNVSFDSVKGFETRGTFRSGERLALEHLFNAAVGKQEFLLSRTKRSIQTSTSTSSPSKNDTFIINYDDYGVDDDNETEITPCGMYINLGKPLGPPYLLIDGSVKAIFEVESFEKLFEVSTLKDLCKLDEIIDRVVKETENRDFVSPAPFSFNLPNYVMCANGSYIKKCNDLDQKTADAFKAIVITCLNPKSEAEILNCETNFATQLRDYILQTPNPPHQIPSGPVYVGAILKLYNNFRTGSAASSNKFFTVLLDRLSNDLGDKIKLKGFFVGSKNAFFEEALYADIILGGGALAMVILGIFLYSKSFAFTCIVLCGMAFAVGTSFFIYTGIFRITFFPFINFLVIVIAIAVGADDAFLLSYQFEKHKQELKHWNAKLLNFDPDLMSRKEKLGYSYSFNETIDFGALDLQTRSQITKAAVSEALKHAAIAMFVTSITTAVAFLTNCFSSILILRCFGIFAAITILANYFFVVSALPAALVLLNSKSCFEMDLYQNCIRKIQTCLTYFSNIYIYRLPLFVYKTFYVIIFITVVIFIGSIYVVCFNPGIRLPEHNAMQLLRSDNPFEWFDEHQKQYFNFSSHQQFMQNFYAIWGIQPTLDSSWINADEKGTLQPGNAIKLSKINLETLNLQMSAIKKAKFLDESVLPKRHKNSTLASRFIKWAQKCDIVECCLNETNILPESCMLNYSKETLEYFKPSQKMFCKIEESAIFEKDSYKFMGFIIQGPSNDPYSYTYHDLKAYFAELDETRSDLKEPVPMILGPPQTTNLFDLLSTLLYGTTVSVGISLGISAFVIVASTTRPLLSLAAILSITFSISVITAILLIFGWTINVIEATILVITIGLCFDYTLHLAVAYKLSSDIVVTEKVREANEACAIPIALASATNIAAGLILFFSKTQAFFEIGVFLVVMTFVSFLSAHFVFVSLIYCFSKFCRNDKI